MLGFGNVSNVTGESIRSKRDVKRRDRSELSDIKHTKFILETLPKPK